MEESLRLMQGYLVFKGSINISMEKDKKAKIEFVENMKG